METARPLTAVICETAIGWTGVALSDRGIRNATLIYPGRDVVAEELSRLGAVEGDDPRIEQITAALTTWGPQHPDALDHFPVDLSLSVEGFSRSVLLGLRDIPAGQTRSYGWLAKHAGGTAADSRAVGSIVGSNPICLWLPCHRVVASDGSLHGFGGGLAMKQAILEHEGAVTKAMALF